MYTVQSVANLFEVARPANDIEAMLVPMADNVQWVDKNQGWTAEGKEQLRSKMTKAFAVANIPDYHTTSVEGDDGKGVFLWAGNVVLLQDYGSMKAGTLIPTTGTIELTFKDGFVVHGTMAVDFVFPTQ